MGLTSDPEVRSRYGRKGKEHDEGNESDQMTDTNYELRRCRSISKGRRDNTAWTAM